MDKDLKEKIADWLIEQPEYWHYSDICKVFDVKLLEAIEVVQELVDDGRFKVLKESEL